MCMCTWLDDRLIEWPTFFAQVLSLTLDSSNGKRQLFIRKFIYDYYVIYAYLPWLFTRSPADNFQDSKEIMMTSDSKADYKYSTIDRSAAKVADAADAAVADTKTTTTATCSEGELRCINGYCITLSQLCDKVRTSTYSFTHLYFKQHRVHVYTIL